MLKIDPSRQLNLGNPCIHAGHNEKSWVLPAASNGSQPFRSPHSALSNPCRCGGSARIHLLCLEIFNACPKHPCSARALRLCRSGRSVSDHRDIRAAGGSRRYETKRQSQKSRGTAEPALRVYFDWAGGGRPTRLRRVACVASHSRR